jgi:hypothetical protein
MLQIMGLLCIINCIFHADTHGEEIIRRIMSFILYVGALLWGTLGLGADCYIIEDCVSVREPNLMERVCFLHSHETKMPPEMERWQIMGGLDVHHDPLHREYLTLLLDKRFVPLKKGTHVFDCGYDILAIKLGTELAKLKGINLPVANCQGLALSLVLVRPVYSPICYWVALGDVECR